MKVSVIYHSVSGNTKKLAEIIAGGAGSVEGIEARAFSIEGIDSTFLEESKAAIIGSPTYLGTYSWQIKQWLDTYKEVRLGGSWEG